MKSQLFHHCEFLRVHSFRDVFLVVCTKFVVGIMVLMHYSFYQYSNNGSNSKGRSGACTVETVLVYLYVSNLSFAIDVTKYILLLIKLVLV